MNIRKDPLEYVTDFEELIANYFGAPYAVAVDCCTHALELCFRLTKPTKALVPGHTYPSVPFMLDKLKCPWTFFDRNWEEHYKLTPKIIDAATLWRKDSYISSTYMCLSFHHKKHLNIDRGGMILLDNEDEAELLRRMSYDGRQRTDVPWYKQNIDTVGYHYYMTPDKALEGIERFKEVSDLTPEIVTYRDYPNLSELEIFKPDTNLD